MTFPPLRTLTLLTSLLALSGCSQEEMVPVGVTGYNHIEDQSIDYFTVNGAEVRFYPHGQAEVKQAAVSASRKNGSLV